MRGLPPEGSRERERENRWPGRRESNAVRLRYGSYGLPWFASSSYLLNILSID